MRARTKHSDRIPSLGHGTSCGPVKFKMYCWQLHHLFLHLSRPHVTSSPGCGSCRHKHCMCTQHILRKPVALCVCGYCRFGFLPWWMDRNEWLRFIEEHQVGINLRLRVHDFLGLVRVLVTLGGALGQFVMQCCYSWLVAGPILLPVLASMAFRHAGRSGPLWACLDFAYHGRYER